MNCETRAIFNARVPMRDDIELACDVYLPPDETKSYPVILGFSPYNATSGRNDTGVMWAGRGFAFASADCRGRFLSEGEFEPWRDDINDAYDLLEWIATQPWCNGMVGMLGGSYPAVTQLAAVCSGHPALKAAAPSAISADPYSLFYSGGAHELSFLPAWYIGVCWRGEVPASPPDWTALRKTLPLVKLDERAGMPSSAWKRIVTHDVRDAMWEELSQERRLEDNQTGLFFQGGWFDVLGENFFDTYNILAKNSDSENAQNNRYTCCRIGPWGHGVNAQEGEVTYGSEAQVTEDQEMDFLTSLLQGKAPGTDSHPSRLQIFVMGANTWRFEKEWPLKRAKAIPLYIGSGGCANTAQGDGCLTWDLAEIASCPPDTYTYDPETPVPTCGGRIVGEGGQRNQTEVEKRDDVLVYTLSSPLSKGLEVTGEVRMRLYASSSACDTDFTVKLVDVYPDGCPMNVCDGILRVRFRGGLDKSPELMTPGTVYCLDILVDVTSYLFKAGHKIRIEIASSNFPRFSRNLNTGNDVATDTEVKCATQTIYHSAEYPSCIILPVVPPELV